jgi:hypothetical protein
MSEDQDNYPDNYQTEREERKPLTAEEADRITTLVEELVVLQTEHRTAANKVTEIVGKLMDCRGELHKALPPGRYTIMFRKFDDGSCKPVWRNLLLTITGQHLAVDEVVAIEAVAHA